MLVCHRLLIEGAKKLYNPELMLIVNFSTPSLKQPSQNILNQGRVDMSNSMVKRMKLLLAELTTEPINAKGFFSVTIDCFKKIKISQHPYVVIYKYLSAQLWDVNISIIQHWPVNDSFLDLVL